MNGIDGTTLILLVSLQNVHCRSAFMLFVSLFASSLGGLSHVVFAPMRIERGPPSGGPFSISARSCRKTEMTTKCSFWASFFDVFRSLSRGTQCLFYEGLFDGDEGIHISMRARCRRCRSRSCGPPCGILRWVRRRRR